MKILLKLMLICFLLIPVVKAEEVEAEVESADVEVTISADGDDVEVLAADDPEILEKKLVVPNVVYVKCTLDLNRWGHSSRCDCPRGSKYDREIGKCLPTTVRTHPIKPIVKTHDPVSNETLEHCSGGSFSHDLKRLTCPDGRSYREETDTLGEIARDVEGQLENHFSEESLEQGGGISGGDERVTDR